MKRSRQLFKGTRGQVLHLLRVKPRTVNDLAAELGLTDNAIRAQLSALSDDGYVEQVDTRPGTRKPEAVFGLTPHAAVLFPKAYGALLGQILDVLHSHLSDQELNDVLEEVGHRLASATLMPGSSDVKNRVAGALDALGRMGGLGEVQEHDGRIVIQGYDCPLAAAVQSYPDACKLAQTLLTDLIGYPVEEHCDRTGAVPRCRFELAIAE